MREAGWVRGARQAADSDRPTVAAHLLGAYCCKHVQGLLRVKHGCSGGKRVDGQHNQALQQEGGATPAQALTWPGRPPNSITDPLEKYTTCEGRNAGDTEVDSSGRCRRRPPPAPAAAVCRHCKQAHRHATRSSVADLLARQICRENRCNMFAE